MQAKKAATSAEKKAQKSRFSLTNLTEEEQRIVDEGRLTAHISKHLTARFQTSDALNIGFEKEVVKDGHKNHGSNFIGYHHYLGKFSDEGNEYFIRFTVQQVRTNPSKPKSKDFTPNQFHSTFISEIEVYENTAISPIKTPSTSLAMEGKSGIIDAKVETFLKNAKFAQLDRGGAKDCG